MKILVVGDANSIFIKQYIEYVLLDFENCEVVLLQEGDINKNYFTFYSEHQIKLEPLWAGCTKILKRLPIIRSTIGVWLWCQQIKSTYKQFDIVHVHGVNRNRGNVALYLKKAAKKIVVSVWGDELFRSDETRLNRYRKYYHVANTITVSTKAMWNEFERVYGATYCEKLHLNKFAIGLFDKIDAIRASCCRKEICREFGIKDPQKRIVFVGYNGREAQRHIEITEQLNSLSSTQRAGITLVYTMTYGVKSKEYLKILKNEIEKLQCDYIILEKFMDEDTTARLRCICDVLLHAQKTDAFSASIQESLYSSSIILNGAWLPYNELPNYHKCFVEYESMDEIAEKLKCVLENYEAYRTRYAGNRGILRELSSREVTTLEWKKALSIESVNL